MDPWAFPQCRRPRVANRRTSLLKIQSSASIGVPMRSPNPLSSRSTLRSKRPIMVFLSRRSGLSGSQQTCSLEEATSDVRKSPFFIRWTEWLGTIRWFGYTFLRKGSYIYACAFCDVDGVAYEAGNSFTGGYPEEIGYFGDDCILALPGAGLPSRPRSLHSHGLFGSSISLRNRHLVRGLGERQILSVDID